MTQDEKRKFIYELVAIVVSDVQLNVPHMPDDWDSMELRQYVADTFAIHVLKLEGTRKRDYDDAVAVNNL